MCVLKMKFLPSTVQKLSSEQTHRLTDGQTDSQTQLKLLPTTYADGNYIDNSMVHQLNIQNGLTCWLVT